MIYNNDTLSFRVLNAGIYRHKNGFFDVKPRSHAAFSYRSRGNAVFTIKGERFEVNEGDVIFIPADTPYTVSYKNSESSVIHLSLCSYTEVDKIVLKNKNDINAHFTSVCEAWRGGASQNKMKSLVFGLLSSIEADASFSAYSSELSKYTDYIEKNYRDPSLTVERICKEKYVSHSTLLRMFMKHLSLSPKEYIVNLRLKNAVELLLSGRVSCRDAAYLSGFSDEKYFSRAFKKHYSVSPSKFLGERG